MQEVATAPAHRLPPAGRSIRGEAFRAVYRALPPELHEEYGGRYHQ
jgi:hypothetical protein